LRPIEQLVRHTVTVLGHEELAARVRFDRRLARTAGQAEWVFDGTYCLRFSGVLWARMTSDERRETIVHETCHLTTVVELGGATSDVLEHCPLWHEHMAHVGYISPTITLHLP
jgi:predicted SprT family Zn-dependent metalloprotease